MNIDETTRLCKLIAAACPAQKFEAETPAIWTGFLEGIRLADALAAIKRLGGQMPFIGPSEINAEVRRIRAERLAVDLPAPNVDPDDVLAWTRELAAIRRAAADGDLDHAAYATSGVALTGGPGLGPARMIEGPPPQLEIRRPERPTSADYEVPKVSPPATVSEVDAGRIEDQRARQLAALQAMSQEAS